MVLILKSVGKMGEKRKIRKILKEKYDINPDALRQFAWFPGNSLPPQRNVVVEEVMSILKSFKPRHLPSQNTVKDLFRQQKSWKMDFRFFKEEGLWSFDAYKDKVAVEVLGKNPDELFKDCFKFLLAFVEKKADIGVVIVPHRKYSRGFLDATSVDSILDRFDPVLRNYELRVLRASYCVCPSK